MSSLINHADIRIGTLASMGNGANYLKQILPHGFESFQLTIWQTIGDLNLEEIAPAVLDTIGDKAIISSLGMFGNPLQDENAAKGWEICIRNAKRFNCNMVCGFAGALEDRPVPESLPKFKEVYGHLVKVAEEEGVRIAFENCDMGGTWERPKWNIAHSPRAWEMMFNEVPSDVLGLEWEPCHQMVSLIDPLPQLRKWLPKIYHVHGKDATINWDVIKEQGLRSGVQAVYHRTPGFGDTNWTDVITILRQGGFTGSIDIEGWHDPIYRGDLEMTGQVYGLNYLKQCRGGSYIPNPS
ncbi:MAG: sugar phosphate isomerase/epimerase [Armatimonadetes bacterium]|nr:sugar phosphate isomerase/epimerase [Armatimonadota bacterium]